MFKRLGAVIRWDGWHNSKIAILAGYLYLFAALTGSTSYAFLFGALLLTMGGAAFGYMINTFADYDFDRAAGKPLPVSKRALG